MIVRESISQFVRGQGPKKTLRIGDAALTSDLLIEILLKEFPQILNITWEMSAEKEGSKKDNYRIYYEHTYLVNLDKHYENSELRPLMRKITSFVKSRGFKARCESHYWPTYGPKHQFYLNIIFDNKKDFKFFEYTGID